MNQHKTTAQDFFLNAGVMVTLYVTVISFLSLFFSLINKLFPDSLSYGYYYDSYSSEVRLAMAALIIVFPLFLWLSRIVVKIITADANRKEMAVRKWLVYITLFLASSALVVDLVTLLNYFLSGEITTRFALKVVAVLVVAGIVFWHYFSEVRGNTSAGKYKGAFWTSIVLVVALLVSAFAVFGSPTNTRKARFDDQRINDLQSIQLQVINYWQQKARIPEKLADLKDPLSTYYSTPTDPETSVSYEYDKTGAKSFKLCAIFNLSNKGADAKASITNRQFDGFANENWQHSDGQYCFDRAIDAELYPVRATKI